MDLRDYDLSLSAGVEQQLRLTGNYCSVYEAADPVLISFDSGPWVSRNEGDEQEFDHDYSDIRIMSVTTQTVTLVAGYGRLRSNIKTVSVTASATVESPSQILSPSHVVIPASSLGLIYGAHTDIQHLYLKAPISNTGPVHLGGSGLGAGQGVSLDPGEGIFMDCRAAVYGYNPDASDSQTIHVTVCRKP